MADAQKLAEEAKKLEEQAKKDKEDSDPKSKYGTTHTKKDRNKKKNKAAKEFEEAAKKRKEAAEAYAGDGNHTLAAVEYSNAAADSGERADLKKQLSEDEDNDDREKDADEYEKALQKQINDLLRAAEEYGKADKPDLAKGKKEAAEKIKKDYDKDHPKSKLKLEK
jgi:hypothetical protein